MPETLGYEEANGDELPSGIQHAAYKWDVQPGLARPPLPEYTGNPLIEALPHPMDPEEFYDAVASRHEVLCNPRDGQELEPRFRMHLIKRLGGYFFPLSRNIHLYSMFDRLIKQGYVARNILSPEHARRSRQLYQAGQEGGGVEKLVEHLKSRTSASGCTILGHSGVGKSLGVRLVLDQFPQALFHSHYWDGRRINLYQVVWLKIDCPPGGSLKGLYQNFFVQMDTLLGTNYLAKFGASRNSEPLMLVHVARVADLHCLGVIVIDELQHLRTAKPGGVKQMLDVFVTLVNTIGLPVVRIGTGEADKLLQDGLRHGRRATGDGFFAWERLKCKTENERKLWGAWVEGLFRLQWTQVRVPCTEEFVDLLYEESQGILDVAVKIHMMAQWRAISTELPPRNGHPGVHSMLTTSHYRQVAADHLTPMRPFLDALKSGDLKRIARYEDVKPLDTGPIFEAYLQELEATLQQHRATKEQLQQTRNTASTLNAVILRLVVELSVAPVVAKYCTEQVLLAQPENAPKPLEDLVKEAYILALRKQGATVPDLVTTEPLMNARDTTSDSGPTTKKSKGGKKVHLQLVSPDLRYYGKQAQEQGVSVYEALKAAGLIREPVADFL